MWKCPDAAAVHAQQYAFCGPVHDGSKPLSQSGLLSELGEAWRVTKVIE